MTFHSGWWRYSAARVVPTRTAITNASSQGRAAASARRCRRFNSLVPLRQLLDRHPVDPLADRHLDMLAIADIPTNDAEPLFPAHPIAGTVRRRYHFLRCRRAPAALAGLARAAAG